MAQTATENWRVQYWFELPLEANPVRKSALTLSEGSGGTPHYILAIISKVLP